MTPQALQDYASQMRRAENARGIFLDTWKMGVRLAGEQFFVISCEHIDAATDKQQLRPDIPAIRR